MSAWPEAVWLAKQMKQNFETNSSLSVYQAELDEWQDQVDHLQDEVNNLSSGVDELSGQMTPPVVDTRDGNNPSGYDGSSTYNNGTLWFIIEGNDSQDQGGQDQEEGQTITDLTNTIWYFNEELNLPQQNNSYDINFTSNSQSFNNIQICFYNEYNSSYYFRYYNSGTSNVIIPYLNPSNENDWAVDYRTISITGGNDVTNTNLISWLQENATLVEQAGE